MAALSAIRRYPVKSCRGWDVDTAVVEPWGLLGDRRWLVTDPGGQGLTAREHRRLLLAEPRIAADGGLELSAPGLEPLAVAVPEIDPSALTRVAVFSTALDATPAAAEADAWFSELLGVPARLVHLDDPTRRASDPRFTRAGDRVSFADAYPVHVTTTSSLSALNAWIADGPRAADGPMAMDRFRANLVVDGTEPWAEDGWRRVRIGQAEFLAVKGCARCAIATTDPETTERRKEPLATLARHRRWDGETWFGMNLVPADPSARPTIRTGDPVEILEAVEHRDGPPR